MDDRIFIVKKYKCDCRNTSTYDVYWVKKNLRLIIRSFQRTRIILESYNQVNAIANEEIRLFHFASLKILFFLERKIKNQLFSKRWIFLTVLSIRF